MYFAGKCYIYSNALRRFIHVIGSEVPCIVYRIHNKNIISFVSLRPGMVSTFPLEVGHISKAKMENSVMGLQLLSSLDFN